MEEYDKTWGLKIVIFNITILAVGVFQMRTNVDKPFNIWKLLAGKVKK